MRRQKFDENLQFTINVERMDQLLKSNAIHIRLMKMDAQGFECNILDGMGEDLANKIDVIKFEYSKTHMHGHDCLDLLKKIDRFKFLSYREFDSTSKGGKFSDLVDPYLPPDKLLRPTDKWGIVDLFASKKELWHSISRGNGNI